MLVDYSVLLWKYIQVQKLVNKILNDLPPRAGGSLNVAKNNLDKQKHYYTYSVSK